MLNLKIFSKIKYKIQQEKLQLLKNFGGWPNPEQLRVLSPLSK